MKLSILDPQYDYRLLDYAITKSIATSILPFNFYSIAEFGIMVPSLYPTKEVMNLLRESNFGDGNTFAFDVAYAKQLNENPDSFIALMNILRNIENIEEVIVLSNYTNPLMMPIIDSLLKFIQEKYGIDAFIINTIDDIDVLANSEFASPQQYMSFVYDLQKYYKMTTDLSKEIYKFDIEDMQCLGETYNGY